MGGHFEDVSHTWEIAEAAGPFGSFIMAAITVVTGIVTFHLGRRYGRLERNEV